MLSTVIVLSPRMSTLVWTILIGLPLMWLVAMAGYAYVDAARHGIDPRKWALVSLLTPLFGFFMYTFERDDRTSEDPEMFADGPFEIHESRADESLVKSGESGESARNEKAGQSDDDSSREWT